MTTSGLEERIQNIENITNSAIDVHTRGPSWGVVCLAGRDNRAYVEFFELPEFENAREFREILRHFRRRTTIDASPGIAPIMRDMMQNTRNRRRYNNNIGGSFG